MPSRSHFCSHPFLLHMAGVAAVQPLPLEETHGGIFPRRLSNQIERRPLT